MQRRDFLKSATFLAVANFMSPAVIGAAEVSAPFLLPSLGYDFRALEPHIDAETMELHHDKHHKAYVEKLNEALAESPPEWSNKSLAELLYWHGPNGSLPSEGPEAMPQRLRAAVRMHGGGHYNHSLFWQVLAPGGENRPVGYLAQAVNKEFGDFDTFRKKNSQTVLSVALEAVGSGYLRTPTGSSSFIAPPIRTVR
jgi:superoxide dismutase